MMKKQRGVASIHILTSGFNPLGNEYENPRFSTYANGKKQGLR